MDESPLAQADAAKSRRDFDGEMSALVDGGKSLQDATWFPARAGDMLSVRYGVGGSVPAHEETYEVVPDEFGSLILSLRSHTFPEGLASSAGSFAPGLPDEPFFEAWMEVGPGSLTIVRDDWVIHRGR
ncbi:hypothetical protein ACPC54_30355 [Kitasatospora sp. NPDC094028]